MILVHNYILGIICCIYCCLCWGSWANTQKMVSQKNWRFELFYIDLTIGLFLAALLGAVTLGSMGGGERTFFTDLAGLDYNSIGYAVLGGIIWNFANVFLTAAIAIAGMSVGFPIGGGLGWIGGIIFNYILVMAAGNVYQAIRYCSGQVSSSLLSLFIYVQKLTAEFLQPKLQPRKRACCWHSCRE